MYKVTQRQLIQGVAENWKRQYQSSNGHWLGTRNDNAQEIYTALKALDLDIATKQDIDAVIENSSWCRLKCDECGRETQTVIQLGEEVDYESSTASVCSECLSLAVKLLEG